MGAQLANYYAIAEKTGGLKATMRLAMKTGLSSDKAKVVPDTAEVIQKFKTAWENIKKEL